MLVKVLRLDTDSDSDLHCSSHFLSEHAQLAFRALALGYCVSTLFSNFVYSYLSFTFFTFFTNLSYILLTIYFGVAVYYTAAYNDPMKTLSPKKICAVNVLLEIVATNALFLDIVYWSLLYRYSDMNTMQYFLCVNVHLVNLLIILTEVITTKFRFEPRHVFITVSVLSIYTVFSIAYYLLGHTWVYPILDWHNPKAPVYYSLCFALNVTCFFVMYGIYRLRERVAAKRHGGFQSIENMEGGISIPRFPEISTISNHFSNTERRFSNISSHASYGTAGPVFPKVTAVTLSEVTPIAPSDNAVMTEVKAVTYSSDVKPLPMFPMVYPTMAGGAAN